MDRRGDRSTEQFRKIFIGGLTPNVTDEDLDTHFSQWGELVDKVVMKDRNTGRSRGFGFVTYKDEESVDQAQGSRPHVLDNKEVETKRALPKDESNREESNMKAEKLFVAGIKPEVTEEELRDYFSQYGEVLTAEICTWKETGKPRGFGFVTFTDYDPVDKCIIYKPHHIGNGTCDVKKALSKEQMAQVKAKQNMGMGASGGYGVSGGYAGNAGYGSAFNNQGYGGGGMQGGYGGGFAPHGGGYDNSVGYGGAGDMNNGGGFGSYGGQGFGGGAMKSGFGGNQRSGPYQGGGRGGRGGRGFRGGGRGRGSF